MEEMKKREMEMMEKEMAREDLAPGDEERMRHPLDHDAQQPHHGRQHRLVLRHLEEGEERGEDEEGRRGGERRR